MPLNPITNHDLNIFISAGDFSGDIHAANLVKSIKKINPSAHITSFGGEQLKLVSDVFLKNLVNLSAFGFWAPLKLYFKLKNIFKENLLKTFDTEKPDKVILVDYYGFNIHIAKEAFKRGIPVYYYISPQVWATRPGRIKKLAKYIKKMLVILPFEEKIYKQAGVDAIFVGHPLLDIVPESSYNLNTNKPVIGLFPGSRKNIFLRHLPLLEKTAELISKEHDCEIKIFTVKSLMPLIKNTNYTVVCEDNFKERKKLNFAITTSGTVSLENTLLGLPMIVFYKLSKFNYYIAKLLVNIKYITMVNILADREVVLELIQEKAKPNIIAKETLNMINSISLLEKKHKELLDFKKQLGEKNVSDRAAKIILSY